MARPDLLIEHWLPIEELGIESQRERGAASALPPLNFLHVWWARRPLTASRAAILGSLLPAWSDSWPKRLRDRFPTDESYRQWFLRLVGIMGDPVAGRRMIRKANETGTRLKGNPYGYRRAFTTNPENEYLETLYDVLEHTWGTRDIAFADPMAGGGSIPFEALRYGLTTFANELNPVAAVILKATLDYPARFGPGLVGDIHKYGNIWAESVRKRLEQFYPLEDPSESIFAYVWARTVACPTTGKPVPLSPNWWLLKPKNASVDKLVAIKLHCDPKLRECQFEIVRRKKAVAAKPSTGTVKGGTGRSPWTNDPIDSQYIKTEAQRGRMRQQLYAVVVKRTGGVTFRLPTQQDLRAVKKAEKELKRRLPSWEAAGLIPREPFPEQSTDTRPIQYGMLTWADFFAPRQLLALGTFLETLDEVKQQARQELGADAAEAVSVYLAAALDKACDHNSRMARWESTRCAIKGTFDRHDYSFKWSHAEYDAAHNLLPWALGQVGDAYKGIAALVEPSHSPLFSSGNASVVDRLRLNKGSSASLPNVRDGSLKLVCVDPPYKANVMYAECSDFFYVWMKRTLGDVFPELFKDELTDKDSEAVSNVARFSAFKGKKKKQLADSDYENKMAACFREMHRMLAPEGVLTVMFTHKEVSAWDALASALIGASFTIHASWPVHTESEYSLHQAKKNAAASTIFLVCRKREAPGEPVWWDDLKAEVRRTAREKAEEFEKAGIRGVDLYISTFGPVLSIISERWPVLTSETDEKGDPKPLRPEQALDLAREEVVALRKRGLLLGRAVQFDPVTDWYLMAWDAFRAQEFPADEARKLALALGLSLEQEIIKHKKLVTKKGSSVVLQEPKARRKKHVVDPELDSFEHVIDAVHTAMLVYDEDGSKGCGSFLKRSGLIKDGTFKACLQALLNAIPRTKQKGEFVRKEAEILENMRLAFFEDLEPPPEEAQPQVQQEMPFRKVADDEE